MYWGDDAIDTVSNWEPYDYHTWLDFNEEPPTRSGNGECIEKELPFSHTYDLEDFGCSPGSTAEFTIIITAESPGGWEMSESYDISIEYIDDDDGGGGGGGGGPDSPPNLPWGDDTWFEEK